jgi:hypothetical protein
MPPITTADDSLLAREQHRAARQPLQSARAERLNRGEQVSCILCQVHSPRQAGLCVNWISPLGGI